MDDTQKKILAVAILGIGAYVFYAAQANAAEAPAPLLPAPDPTPPPVKEAAPPTPNPPPRRSAPATSGGPTGPIDIKTLQQRLNWLHDAVSREGVDPAKAGVLKIDLSQGGVGKFGPKTKAARDGAWKLISEVYRIHQGATITPEHVFLTSLAASLGGAGAFKDIKNIDKFCNSLNQYTAQMSLADRAAIKEAAKNLASHADEEESVPGYANTKDSGRIMADAAAPEIEQFKKQLNLLHGAILGSGATSSDMVEADLHYIPSDSSRYGDFDDKTQRAANGMLRLMLETAKLYPYADSQFTTRLADITPENFMSVINVISVPNMKASDKQKLVSALKGASGSSIASNVSVDQTKALQRTKEIEKFQQQLNSLYSAVLSLSGVSVDQLNRAGVYKIETKGSVGVLGPQTRRAADGMSRLLKETARLNPSSSTQFTSDLASAKFNNFMPWLNSISLTNITTADKQKLAGALKNLSLAPVLTERFV